MKRFVVAVVVAFAASSASAQQAPDAHAGHQHAAAAATGKTEITWYGQATFLIRTPGGTTILTDPWISNPLAKAKALKAPEKVDFILITHGHFDHTADAISIGKATGAKLVAPNELAKALAAAGYPVEPARLAATAGNVGGTMKLNDEVSVTMVPAVHSSGYQKDAQSPSENGGNPVGFFIHIKGGPRIYHTGDTAAFSEIQFYAKRWPIDVMLACIGGHFTMDPVGAAQQVAWVNPKVVVPMHWGTYPLLAGRPAELQAALKERKSKTKMIEMAVGETRSF
jgi:L-ascorbate metabolism protein UlaG (beta-lactamase superfamily)